MPLDYENLTAAEAADLFGRKERWFRELQADGHMPKTVRGRGFHVRDVCRGFEGYARSRQKQPEPKPHVADPKDAIDRAKLEKLEMDNAIRRREYAPIRMFETYCERVGAVIHSHFEALAGQVKQRIPHLRAAEVAIIRNELAKCASGIADFTVIDESPA